MTVQNDARALAACIVGGHSPVIMAAYLPLQVPVA